MKLPEETGLPRVVNLADKARLLDEAWSPRVVAELNDYQFRLARLDGEFVWHQHDDTDEAFLCLQGSLSIEFRDGAVELAAGELCVVPRGVEHRPVARNGAVVLLLEPRETINTGDADSELRADNDRWI